MWSDRLPFLHHKGARVAVLRLNGVIGRVGGGRRGLNLQGLERRLDAAFKSRQLVAVAVSINSPGGSPVQSELITERIRDLAAEKDVPVYTFIEDVGASGGYWLACAGDEIYARNSSIVGSIGVVSGGFGFTELIQKLGIERRLHTSGDKKAMNDPFGPEKPAAVKHLKELQKDIHKDFIRLVKARRGDRLNGTDRTLFSGAYWTGTRALEFGLIDGIGDLRGIMRAKLGDDVKFKVFDERGSRLLRWFSIGALPDSCNGVGSGLVDDLVAAVEERLWWNRFGL